MGAIFGRGTGVSDNGLLSVLAAFALAKRKLGENVPVPVVGVFDLLVRDSSLLISTVNGSNLGIGCVGTVA